MISTGGSLIYKLFSILHFFGVSDLPSIDSIRFCVNVYHFYLSKKTNSSLPSDEKLLKYKIKQLCNTSFKLDSDVQLQNLKEVISLLNSLNSKKMFLLYC